MAELDIKIEGLAELDRKLRGMTDNLAQRALRNAVRAGATVVLRDMRTRVPVGPAHFEHGTKKHSTKHLRDALRISTRFSGLTASASVTPGKAAFLANWLERTGAKAHRIPKRGNQSHFVPGIGWVKPFTHPGMKPRPFMLPAFNASWQQALEKFTEVLKEQIAKFTRSSQ